MITSASSFPSNSKLIPLPNMHCCCSDTLVHQKYLANYESLGSVSGKKVAVLSGKEQDLEIGCLSYSKETHESNEEGEFE